jgi:hypothetical protein
MEEGGKTGTGHALHGKKQRNLSAAAGAGDRRTGKGTGIGTVTESALTPGPLSRRAGKWERVKDWDGTWDGTILNGKK